MPSTGRGPERTRGLADDSHLPPGYRSNGGAPRRVRQLPCRRLPHGRRWQGPGSEDTVPALAGCQPGTHGPSHGRSLGDMEIYAVSSPEVQRRGRHGVSWQGGASRRATTGGRLSHLLEGCASEIGADAILLPPTRSGRHKRQWRLDHAADRRVGQAPHHRGSVRASGA